MKLVYKTILINTIISISILFIGEWCLYLSIKQKLRTESVEHLLQERVIILEKLNDGMDIDLFKNNVGNTITAKEIETISYVTPVVKDTTLTEQFESEEEEEEEEGELFSTKKIIFDIQHHTKNYRITILKTTDADENLGNSILVILTLSGIIMLLALITINVLVYNKLFSPIYKLIRDVRDFSIHKQTKINAPKTSIIEFAELGNTISNMSKKNIDDYISMKEFTENMAHEVQTPLAVISSKLEQCVQDKHLTESQSQLLGDANKALNKLFNLNKGLSLLTKIENRQYNGNTSINISSLIHERLGYFSDFIEDKNILVSETYSNEIIRIMDVSLAEILLDNILKNAIKHNIESGHITILLEKNTLTISNTGEAPSVETSHLFSRFYSKNTNESLGLGLSIVKKIIDYYQFEIDYEFINGNHQISISF